VTREPVDWVDPLINTGEKWSAWHDFAGTARPNPMVSLFPDTVPAEHYFGGYRYDVNTIHHFSHVHAFSLAGIAVMPTTGPLKGMLGSEAYRSRFRHESEIARAGFYAVTLDDYRIRVELTATQRVGFHRYRFPKAESAHILFDLGAKLGGVEMADTCARKVSDTQVEGFVVNAPTVMRPKPVVIHFVAQFDKPFNAFGGWRGDRPCQTGVAEVSGPNGGVFARFSTREGEAILLKVAISYVSIEQARLNLETEIAHWDFDGVREESRDVWNRWLGKIRIEGGSVAQRTKFYTDLWRVLTGRKITSDANGKTCDRTGAAPVIRQIPLGADGQSRYDTYIAEVWGSYWNLDVVWGLAYPELLSRLCCGWVAMYEHGGLIPRFVAGDNYCFGMIAAHSTPLLVSAYMKGLADFDAATAYRGMRKNALPGGLMSKAGYEHDSFKGGGVEYYLERGYVPEGRGVRVNGLPSHVDGASQTLEYAYDDWALAQMAKALGQEADHRVFLKRAGNYTNIFDVATGFMRPRNLDGSWLDPFDPLKGTGWCEANAWNYTWYVPHDIQGLIHLLGGRDAFIDKLNYAFEQAAPFDFIYKDGLTQETCHVNYANQPSMAMAHLFNYAGAPWLSQKWVRAVKEQAFGGIGPYDGYPDDDDMGQQGGLGVLMAIGLFEVNGGAVENPVYEITSPIFDKVTIQLDARYYPGGTFEIVARYNSKANMYIQSATLNGEVLNRPWFYHRQLVNGGRLELELGPEPNKQWGSRPEDAPPSMTLAVA
jgi:predicted alpha-1,2-mannosidase